MEFSRQEYWSGLPFPSPGPGFPCGSAGKESTCNVGDQGSIPGLGRSPGEEKDYPLQYSGLETSMDCIVHGVAKSRTRLSNFHFTSLLQGIFLTQGSNPGLSHCVQMLYRLSHQGIPHPGPKPSGHLQPHSAQETPATDDAADASVLKRPAASFLSPAPSPLDHWLWETPAAMSGGYWAA